VRPGARLSHSAARGATEVASDPEVFVSDEKKDQVLNPAPFKHYRRSYSRREVQVGAAVLTGLAGIGAWVGYKGSDVDPSLYGESPSLIRRSPTVAVDRGPLPTTLAPAGFKERGLSVFGKDNLYEKINGREGFYKSFGFEQLHFLTLVDESAPDRTIDLELFDLGSAANALGAFAAESGPDAKAESSSAGLFRLDRNAAYLARGRFYARAVGSEESAAMTAALSSLTENLSALEGEALPWSYALFADGFGLAPGKVAFFKEDAFSFGFAKRFFSATLDDGETEVFVAARKDDATAAALAHELTEGFAMLGDKSEQGGVTWVTDRYIARVSGAKASGPFVIGVKSAASSDEASALLLKLDAALSALDDGAKRGAREDEERLEEATPGAGAGNGESYDESGE